jgi:predicted GIY-YIG superfamily endonuclease
MANKYSNTVIYKIFCRDADVKDIYIGYTTNFTVRKYTHSSCCRNENETRNNQKLYTFMRNNGGLNNWDFEIIETINCDCRQEALERERYWYKTLNASLNENYTGLTPEERLNYRHSYYENNKDVICNRSKHTREQNREALIDYHKNYRVKNAHILNAKVECECGGCYISHHKSSHIKTHKHLAYEQKYR